MDKTLWGQSDDGQDIYRYTLTAKSGLTCTLMNYGANLLNLYVPDKSGNLLDVVLGYKDLKSYFVNDPGFGCSITPCANRIGNAAFTLNGKEYKLEANDGPNNLHSSSHPQPLHRRTWNVDSASDDSITFSIDKAHMDMGFPGNMHISVTYTLSDDGLAIEYRATSDEKTVFNPTNHSYFNLNGADSGSVLDQLVTIDADYITKTDERSIPTGELSPVDGSMDFRTEKAIGRDIEDKTCQALCIGGGYDHNYVINNYDGSFKKVASLYSKDSGILMDVSTDMPGIQFYSANYLNSEEPLGKNDFTFGKRFGAAFETQFFPNAVNIPSFKQPVIDADQEFYSKTAYSFSVR